MVGGSRLGECRIRGPVCVIAKGWSRFRSRKTAGPGVQVVWPLSEKLGYTSAEVLSRVISAARGGSGAFSYLTCSVYWYDEAVKRH